MQLGNAISYAAYPWEGLVELVAGSAPDALEHALPVECCNGGDAWVPWELLRLKSEGLQKARDDMGGPWCRGSLLQAARELDRLDRQPIEAAVCPYQGAHQHKGSKQ
jgi:hypothetical protein